MFRPDKHKRSTAQQRIQGEHKVSMANGRAGNKIKIEGSAGADQALEDGTFSADVLMWVSLPGDLAEPFRHFLMSTLPTAYLLLFPRTS